MMGPQNFPVQPRRLDGMQGGRPAGSGMGWANGGFSPRPNGGIGDYTANKLVQHVAPNPGALEPHGPANFPIALTDEQGNPVETPIELLRQIRDELRGGNSASRPMMRAKDVTDVGQTMDWSTQGLMDRVMLRNKGTNSLWFSFDVDGALVDTFTSDLSFELQAQEAIAIPRCLFYKIGCKCASGESATVHAIAFMSTAGNLGKSII